MRNSDTSFSLSSLLCQEDESCLNEHQDRDIDLNSFSISEFDAEYIEMLIQKETSFESNSYKLSTNCSYTNESWLKCARRDAIKWFLNTRAFFGFHFRTVYLALTYFDRFFSRRSIDEKLWVIRLLSVACLSLAAKMEECKVPALSQYHVDEYNFERNVIQRMELLVLNTLKWRMGLITPFVYLHYFIIKFCGDSRPKELVSRAMELILAITKEINLMEERPSIIAAAAVLVAYDDHVTRKSVDFKTSVISSWGSLEKEHVFSCYNLLQKIEMEKCKTPNSLISPNLLSTHSSSADVEDSYINSAIGTKRKLTYDFSDQHFPLGKIPRLL